MKRGVDKGFCLWYWRLSTRRKFIRQLWMTPVVFALLLSSIWLGAREDAIAAWIMTSIALFIFGILVVPSIVDKYRDWKEEEKSLDS